MNQIDRQITVLLTGAGAPGMPGILTCLKKAPRKLRLIGVDMDPNAPSRLDFSGFYQIPAAKDDSFIPTILEIAKREQVDIIVPCVTRELAKFAEARELFAAEGIIVATMDPHTIDVANNKGKLLTAIKQAGLPTAEFYLANTIEEVESAFNKLGYPERAVCVKAVEGNGSRAVRLVDPKISMSNLFFNEKPNGMYISKHDLIALLRETPKFPKELMLMQALPGDEYAVDLVTRNGETLTALCRKGMQVVSSNQTMSVVVDEPEVIAQCEKIVKLLKLSGNVGFDLKCSEDGTPYILEINPRFTGGIVTCLAADANMPWMGICSWLGLPFEKPKLQIGVKMQRYWNERFYDVNGNLMELG